MTIEERVENMQRLSGTDVRKCMKCGKCSGRCPAFKDMDIKPHQFVSLLATEKSRSSSNVMQFGIACPAWLVWNVAPVG